MKLRMILAGILTAVVLIWSATGCGSEKGKGSNAGRDRPTRPEK